MKPIHFQETYPKKSETKDERVFNGDDPKENKAFFTALNADEKERIESNKQSIDYFEKTLYKYSEILTCEVKTKNEASELKALVLDRLLALQEFRAKDEFTIEYDRLILFSKTLISKIDAKIINLPNNDITQPKSKQLLEPNDTKPEEKNNFTALQWSTIFYYVAPDLYGEIQQKKDKLEKFRKDFNVSNSQSYLSIKHNEIVRVINGDEKNELKQHHINTIKAILPYLGKNYIEAFKNAKDDFKHLQDELDRK